MKDKLYMLGARNLVSSVITKIVTSSTAFFLQINYVMASTDTGTAALFSKGGSMATEVYTGVVGYAGIIACALFVVAVLICMFAPNERAIQAARGWAPKILFCTVVIYVSPYIIAAAQSFGSNAPNIDSLKK